MDGEGVACHIRRALAELKAPRLVEGSWGLSKTGARGATWLLERAFR